MHARVALGVGKGVLFREVSSFQGSSTVYGKVLKTCPIIMNSTKVQNPRRNSYAGTGCRHLLLRYPLHMRV